MGLLSTSNVTLLEGHHLTNQLLDSLYTFPELHPFIFQQIKPAAIPLPSRGTDAGMRGASKLATLEKQKNSSWSPIKGLSE